MRKSGAHRHAAEPTADWSHVGDRAHFVQFYTDDFALVNLLAPFIGTALVTGESSVVIATKRHRELVEKQLKLRGLNIAIARKQGRYIALDAAETLAKLLHDGWPDPVKFNAVITPVIEAAMAASNRVRPRVAAFGEMVALLWARGETDAAIRLEELWNELAQTHAFALCCAYPMDGFHGRGDAAAFVQVCARHSHVFAAESRPRAAAPARS